MKHFSKACFLFLSLLSFNAFSQSTIGIDTGLYTADDLPVQAPSSATVTHKYLRLNISHELPKEINFSAYGEYVEVQMNDFSIGSARDGDAQKGLGEVGFNLGKEIYQHSDWYNLSLNLGMSAPGFGYNAQLFNAPGQGFTAYIASLGNYFSLGDFGLNLSFTYKYRPGSLKGIEAPDQFIYDISIPYSFAGNHFVSVGYQRLQAQSGIELGEAQGRLFPVVKEASKTYNLTYGLLFADVNQLEFTYSLKKAIDNTDGGKSLSLSYLYNF
jgi:hypothetical protein